MGGIAWGLNIVFRVRAFSIGIGYGILGWIPSAWLVRAIGNSHILGRHRLHLMEVEASAAITHTRLDIIVTVFSKLLRSF